MNLLFARKLVVRASQLYSAKTSALSRAEISAKMNEIKFLAEKKKTSKLTIKREIQSLEHKLEGVFDLQKNITTERKKQAQKEAIFKKRITQLEHQLELGKDKSIHKKIERLSSILSDHIVKQKVKQDVDLQISVNETLPPKSADKYSNKIARHLHQTRLEQAQNQIDKLKEQLKTKNDTLDEISKQILEEKIHLLEIKLGIHIENLHHQSPTAPTPNETLQKSITPHTPPPQSPSPQLSPPNIQNPQLRHTILMTPPPQKHEDIPPELASRLASNQSTDKIGKRQSEHFSYTIPPPSKRQI